MLILVMARVMREWHLSCQLAGIPTERGVDYG